MLAFSVNDSLNFDIQKYLNVSKSLLFQSLVTIVHQLLLLVSLVLQVETLRVAILQVILFPFVLSQGHFQGRHLMLLIA